ELTPVVVLGDPRSGLRVDQGAAGVTAVGRVVDRPVAALVVAVRDGVAELPADAAADRAVGVGAAVLLLARAQPGGAVLVGAAGPEPLELLRIVDGAVAVVVLAVADAPAGAQLGGVIDDAVVVVVEAGHAGPAVGARVALRVTVVVGGAGVPQAEG